MIKQGKGGKIIGACSIAGFKPVCLNEAMGGYANVMQSLAALPYNVSKWGVRGLTLSTALELAPYKINVSVPQEHRDSTDLRQVNGRCYHDTNAFWC